ncbi:DUF1028 domain-containing protein [Marinomonas aquiplantarum]|uniref:Putative Ntn-hydrolase superfamily protein n=1 Tax=Marinomonas aquiplantarum TaxID=491951 RepID=A0A366D2M0_9GAMM|nr:DUF1028 domain-containing protein [Marinomonas aquiplantarum]RBO84175.1 putative Ntn-hydrolase superfamily protein [Marinomonas aquiplantarum]
MTFSIAGYCKKTGMVGSAITSSSICVASRCAFAKSDVGVVLTQNVTNPALGPFGLEQLSSGATPEETLEKLKEHETYIEYRQLGILNAQGEGVTFSGVNALGIYNEASGNACIAMGNLLDNSDVPAAMIASFESNEDLPLPQRLLSALQAGLDAGGEAGSVQSAGLQVYSKPSWPIVDLRVDWHDAPLSELQVLLDMYEPQMNDYILRAESPAHAASYGVPGDL